MPTNDRNNLCDCCGIPYHISQKNCLNCGYPVELTSERTFLQASVQDLERLLRYNSAYLTILDLVRHYRQRLSYLDQVEHQHPQPRKTNPLSVLVPEAAQPVTSISLPTPEPVLNTAPKVAFSFQAFFADQSINIVAALGAFLILVGSLSFVATESDTFLAFVILLGVHVFFGLTGAFTFRFPSVRIVSVIYTAIFALQIPLVGFAFYGLVNTKILQIPPAALIASAAVYAMFAYGALAIYQHFKPFGYFAAVSLAVADLAICWALRLPVWWWPCAFLFLAFPLLLFVSPVRSDSLWDILRGPARVLMYICVYVSCCCAALTFLFLIVFDQSALSYDVRFSFALLAVFLLIWLCLFVWRTQRYALVQLVPYLLFVVLYLWLYMYMSQPIGYIIAFTLLGVCYWALTQRMFTFSWLVKPVINQLEFIIVLLALLVTWLSDPLMIFQMWSRSYGMSFPMGLQPSIDRWLLLDLVAILIVSLLIFGISINHIGWQKAPELNRRAWCWLVLLSGLLLNYAYGIVLLWSASSLLWGWFAFALACAGVTYVVRHLTTKNWAYPLAILSLCVAIESLLLNVSAQPGNLALILLFYLAASYILAIYLRQPFWLVVPVGFAALSLLIMLQVPQILFALNIISPIIIISLYQWGKNHLVMLDTQLRRANSWVSHYLSMWPALFIGFLYAITFILHEIDMEQTSALSFWLAIPDAFAVEMALLAVLWYVSAILTRQKWLLVVSTIFAGVAIQFPALPFWFLVGLAIGLMIVAMLVRSRVGSDWTLPFYLAAIMSAVMMGCHGSVDGSSLVAWMLILFAGLTYFAGIIFEKDKRIQFGLLWSFAILTCWSLFVVSLLGDFYRLPLFTLAFACIGVGMHAVRQYRNGTSYRRLELAQILPIYTVACFAALLAGLSAMFNGINVPFYGAVPGILFVYALIAYGIALFECKAVGLWLSAILAFWATLLFSTMVSCTSVVQFPPLGQVNCAMQLQLASYSLASIVFICCVLGMLNTRLLKRWIPFQLANLSGGMWYGVALVAAGITCIWCELHWAVLPHVLVIMILVFFIALVLLVMFIERTHELIVLVAVLSTWIIVHLALPLWFQLGLGCVLFIFVFASQFIWSYIPPFRHAISSKHLAQSVALVGQFLVICVAIWSGGLLSSNGLLAHMGGISLLDFALLFLCYGMQQEHHIPRRRVLYWAGLLFSLVVTWELLAFGWTDFSALCASPAIYLIVISPFISKDGSLPEHARLGQICSLIGAILLLAPTLWLSFSYNNVSPSLLLAGESIVLLMLGFITRVRIFILSSTALIIVTTIHVIFLPSLGIPTFLALFLVGGFLILLATTLLLIRSRLTAFWSQVR